MTKKYISITLIITIALLILPIMVWWYSSPTPHEKIVIKKPAPTQTTPDIKKNITADTVTEAETKAKPTLKKALFTQLPGWKTTPIRRSLNAFRASCKTFLKQDPDKSVGTDLIELHVKDWQPACRAAMSLTQTSESVARSFFQTWFRPVEFHKNKPVRGLFTGYFMPLLHGNTKKTSEYNVPIYGLPSNLITSNSNQSKPAHKNQRVIGRLKDKKLVPFYTREEISNGAIRGKAPVLFWVNDPIDRLFLEIEGAGAIELDNGKHVYVGYAGENGAPYTSIASVMIKQKLMTPDNASSKNIKRYLNAHPQKIEQVLNKNKSFIFFEKLEHGAALGAQGVPLTPGYSLAVDRSWIPYGTPAWLSTTLSEKEQDETAFNRLMIAQDTGGAIRGMVRGDIFWGAGKKAAYNASNMRNDGRYWLLLPRHVSTRYT